MTPSSATVVQLAPDVFQFVGQRRCAHAYLLRGTRRTALIDTGLATTTDHLVDCLGQVGLDVDDVDLVVLTHEHVDHSGGASLFAGRSLIAAHPLAANKLRIADEFALMSRAFATAATPFDVDLLLTEGCAIDLGGIALDVLHTPGHCSGSICLLEPSRRWLFSADTIMARGVVGGVLHSGNTSDYIASLQRLQRLRIDRLLPGHGHLSDEAHIDIALGIGRLETLMHDSQALFSALRGTEDGHDEVMRSLRDLNVL